MGSWLGPPWTTMAEASHLPMRAYERISLVHVFACFINGVRAFACSSERRFHTTDELNVMRGIGSTLRCDRARINFLQICTQVVFGCGSLMFIHITRIGWL